MEFFIIISNNMITIINTFKPFHIGDVKNQPNHMGTIVGF